MSGFFMFFYFAKNGYESSNLPQILTRFGWIESKNDILGLVVCDYE